MKEQRIGSTFRRKRLPEHACLAVIAFTAFTLPAWAEDITFAVIGPHEYDLPVDFKPFNVFVQYGEWNDGAQQYNSHGNTINGPGTHLFEGLSKYVHFWSMAAFPGMGFAYEVIEPEVRITGSHVKASGFADPLTGPAVWFKPTPQSTLGLQSFLQIPIGNSEVTNNYWANYTSIFFDYQHPYFTFTGNLGVVFRSNFHDGSNPEIDEGRSYHFNGRLGYNNPSLVEPFVGLDWEVNDPSRVIGGLQIPNSGTEETAGGAGVMLKWAPSVSLTLRYSHSLQARNVPRTDAGYLKFVYLW
jgi:hypothetical protein